MIMAPDPQITVISSLETPVPFLPSPWRLGAKAASPNLRMNKPQDSSRLGAPGSLLPQTNLNTGQVMYPPIPHPPFQNGCEARHNTGPNLKKSLH